MTFWFADRDSQIEGPNPREQPVSRQQLQASKIRGFAPQLLPRLGREQLQAVHRINQGRHKPELMTDFGHYVVDRWEPVIYPILRFSTSRNYRHMVQRHLLPFFGKIRLPENGSAEVQMFLAQKSKVYSPKTVLSLRNLLSKIFSTAQKWGYLQMNPAHGTQVPTPVMTRERLTLTPKQVRVLLNTLPYDGSAGRALNRPTVQQALAPYHAKYLAHELTRPVPRAALLPGDNAIGAGPPQERVHVNT